MPNPASVNVYGTGIGLSLVKELVKAHRGLLYVKSEPCKGSSFRILISKGERYLLPEEIIEGEIQPDQQEILREKQEEFIDAKMPKPDDIIVPINQSAHLPLVLVVEDNIELRNYLSGQLKNSFRVIEASNGREGLDPANIQSPDLIISDIMMPELDGLELCAQTF